jgi:hypothetical protein
MVFFIKNNVPSSKNSKRWTGKMLISSKLTLKYYNDASKQLTELKTNFKTELSKRSLSKPLLVGFHFVRDSKRKYDWINPLQTIQDFLVKNEIIEDDNVFEMFPMPLSINGEFTSINKDNPGVYIKLLNMTDDLIKKLEKNNINSSLKYNSIRIQIEDKLDSADNVMEKFSLQEVYNEFMEFYVNYLDSVLTTNQVQIINN